MRTLGALRGGWVGLALALARAASADDASLLEAVKTGDVRAVHSLVEARADVNAREPDGTTPLHWAAHLNHEQIVDLLVRAGADVNAANRHQATPLHLACENGSAGVVEQLLRAGADPNRPVADGETPLMTAARAGGAAAVRALIAKGADVRAAERWRGQTALMWAVAENNADAARALLEAGAEVGARSNGGFTPLLFAVRGGHIAAADVLLAAGADVNEPLPDGTSPLVLAVINAHYELAAHLLTRGADPNATGQGWTALHQLAWTRRPNRGFANPGPAPTGTLDGLGLIKALVAAGADPDARQTKEPRDGYRNLLNRVGATPFLLAAKSADVPLMRALLAAGADPRISTADGTTPLMAAAGVGIWAVGESPGTNEEALEAVRLALDVGGDVNAQNAYGQTAVHGAAHRGANAVIELLVENGARLDVAITKAGGGALGWKEGWTPLMIAEGLFYANSFKRHPETAALLRRLLEQRGQ